MVREIPLTKGYVALVDDADYEWAAQYRWLLGGGTQHHRDLYAFRNAVVDGKKVRILMHRELMGSPAGMDVDHANGNGLDNQRSTNLRVATRSENARNRPRLTATNKSGYRGVSWCSAAGKWRATISVMRKQIHLGVFENKVDAALAFDKSARDVYGEFGRLNFPEIAK